jgi:hypothetical protein
MFGKKCQVQPKCNTGIRDQGIELQSVLGSKGNGNEAFTQALVLKFKKQTVQTSMRI